MRRYIITGTMLLALSMACEEKKKTTTVTAPPPQDIVLTSPIEISLPSVSTDADTTHVKEKEAPADSKVVDQEKDKAPATEPKMALAAKVAPAIAPVKYEDVSSRVLAEGSRDEAIDIGLAKIREKAMMRMKEMQDIETAEAEKIKADEAKEKAETLASEKAAQDEEKAKAAEALATVAVPTPAVSSPEATAVKEDNVSKEDVGSKVAMVEAEALNAAETPVTLEASKDPTQVEEPLVIKSGKMDAKTAKGLEVKFRKARELARVGQVEAAKNLFLTICQAGHAHACHKFGWYEEQAGNTQNATRFYRAACDNGLGKSCNNLAFQFEQQKVYDKAMELYAKGCMEKHEASCTSMKRIRDEQLQEIEKEKSNLQTN